MRARNDRDLVAHTPDNKRNLASAFLSVREEYDVAASKFPPFHSAHEGYAILLEEMRELEQHVFTNQRNRSYPAMRKEANQVAAMAIRFVVDICDKENRA